MEFKKFFVSPSQRTGQHYEALALRYFEHQGLNLLAQNYNTRYGEIDLILEEQDSIVFVEVRFRKNTDYGNAVESVTYAKQKKIIKTAKLFLLSRGLYDRAPCRFDILGITGTEARKLNYQWIKNAFQ